MRRESREEERDGGRKRERRGERGGEGGEGGKRGEREEGKRGETSLVPRLHPAHTRRRGLVSQVQILGPAEVPKPCNC